MKKRGRPRKDGREPAYVLERIVLVVHAYALFREAGEKHSVAICEVVEYIRKIAPAMRISKTEVSRILAAWLPRCGQSCLVVRKPLSESDIRRLPNGRTVRVLYTVSVERRPLYPRANVTAKAVPSTSSTPTPPNTLNGAVSSRGPQE